MCNISMKTTYMERRMEQAWYTGDIAARHRGGHLAEFKVNMEGGRAGERPTVWSGFCSDDRL